MKLLLPVLAAALIAISGCARNGGHSQSAGRRLQIAGLGKSVDPFWQQVEMGMKAGGKDVNADVEFYVPSKEDAQQQAAKVKSWVALGTDGILFAASDPQTMGPAIKDAIARHITCAAMDTDAPGSGRVAYVGTDNYAAGKLAGAEMGRLLGGKGKVCISTGSLTASNSLARIRGFKDALKQKYPGVTVLPEILDDNEDRAVAEEKAKAELAAVPDVAGFFAVYAMDGPACANAVKAAGKIGNIHIVCFDTSAEQMNMLKSGRIDAIVGQRPYLIGRKGVELLADVIREGKDKALAQMHAKGAVIDTGVDLVHKSDMEQYRAELKKLGIPTTGW